MSHIPYYGEEPFEAHEPRHAPTPPRSDDDASPEEDPRALRFWAAHRGVF